MLSRRISETEVMAQVWPQVPSSAQNKPYNFSGAQARGIGKWQHRCLACLTRLTHNYKKTWGLGSIPEHRGASHRPEEFHVFEVLQTKAVLLVQIQNLFVRTWVGQLRNSKSRSKWKWVPCISTSRFTELLDICQVIQNHLKSSSKFDILFWNRELSVEKEKSTYLCCLSHSFRTWSVSSVKNKVRFDSLITQHPTRYLNENRSSRAGEQINCFYRINLLQDSKRCTHWGVRRPGSKLVPAWH